MGEKKLMSTSHGFNKKRLTKPGDSTPHSNNRGSVKSNFDENTKMNEDVSYLKTREVLSGLGADTNGEQSRNQAMDTSQMKPSDEIDRDHQ